MKSGVPKPLLKLSSVEHGTLYCMFNDAHKVIGIVITHEKHTCTNARVESGLSLVVALNSRVDKMCCITVQMGAYIG